MKQQELEDRLIRFGVNVVQLMKRMPGSAASVNLVNQLVRSATAPALLYAEACAAESLQDFIHKMSVGLKELRESRTSLRLVLMNGYIIGQAIESLIDESDQLVRIFGKSINTCRNRLKPSN
ncbi:MAG: four helix bundle protein [Bacteroidota bacterium]